MTRQPIRSAIVGTGFIGPHHIDAVRRGGYGEVVTLVDRDPERGPETARALGVERSVTRFEEALSDPSIDVVHICTPNHTHVELAGAALEAGKHVVVEKPVATRPGRRGIPHRDRRPDGPPCGGRADLPRLPDGPPGPRPGPRRTPRPAAPGSRRLPPGLAGGRDRLQLAPRSGGRRSLAGLRRHRDPLVRHGRVHRGRPRRGRDGGPRDPGPDPTPTGPGGDCLPGRIGRQRARRDQHGGRGNRPRPLRGRRPWGTRRQPGQPRPQERSDRPPVGSRSVARLSQEAPEQLWLGARHETSIATRAPSPEDWTVGDSAALPAGHPEGWSDALRDVLRPFYAAIAAGDPPSADDASPYPTLADGARGVALIEAVVESSRAQRWVDVEPVRGHREPDLAAQRGSPR